MQLPRIILLIAVALAAPVFNAPAADDAATAAARASLERIQTLRKERPGDAVLVFFQAFTHMNLGEAERCLRALAEFERAENLD